MKTKSGLTMIELMIALVAASILILIVTLILFMAFNSWHFNNAMSSMRRDIAIASEMLTHDIREVSLNDIDINAGQLTAKNISYIWTGNSLLRQTPIDSAVIIGKNLTGFTAQTNASADGVELYIVLENSNFGIGITNQLFINTRN